MRTGRPTDDKKDTTLKLRLSDDMRQHIEKMASKRGISMSEYIRHLIESDIRDQEFSTTYQIKSKVTFDNEIPKNF